MSAVCTGKEITNWTSKASLRSRHAWLISYALPGTYEIVETFNETRPQDHCALSVSPCLAWVLATIARRVRCDGVVIVDDAKAWNGIAIRPKFTRLIGRRWQPFRWRWVWSLELSRVLLGVTAGILRFNRHLRTDYSKQAYGDGMYGFHRTRLSYGWHRIQSSFVQNSQ